MSRSGVGRRRKGLVSAKGQGRGVGWRQRMLGQGSIQPPTSCLMGRVVGRAGWGLESESQGLFSEGFVILRAAPLLRLLRFVPSCPLFGPSATALLSGVSRLPPHLDALLDRL